MWMRDARTIERTGRTKVEESKQNIISMCCVMLCYNTYTYNTFPTVLSNVKCPNPGITSAIAFPVLFKKLILLLLLLYFFLLSSSFLELCWYRLGFWLCLYSLFTFVAFGYYISVFLWDSFFSLWCNSLLIRSVFFTFLLKFGFSPFFPSVCVCVCVCGRTYPSTLFVVLTYNTENRDLYSPTS